MKRALLRASRIGFIAAGGNGPARAELPAGCFP